MSNKLFGRSERKRNWGRSTRIDSWERLRLVVDLMKSSLPVDISIDVNHVEALRGPLPPQPYDPRTETSMMIPAPLPVLAEVRVSLCIDEKLAWLLPVQFCMDHLLTAEEVVTKLADAFWFLQGWSQVHSPEAREHLRAQCVQAQRPAKTARKYLLQ